MSKHNAVDIKRKTFSGLVKIDQHTNLIKCKLIDVKWDNPEGYHVNLYNCEVTGGIEVLGDIVGCVFHRTMHTINLETGITQLLPVEDDSDKQE
ncbi:hypothetical protein KC887_04840 [Candidatus Kaiserbacteria bacterium]|nr:hypothetical protein [Candidatus Kaiserbacteria bacterium]